MLDRGVRRNFYVGRVCTGDPLVVQWFAPTDPDVLDGSWMPVFKENGKPHVDKVFVECVHRVFVPIPCFGSDFVVLPDDVIDFVTLL